MGKWLSGFVGVILVAYLFGLIRSGTIPSNESMPDADVMPPILESIPEASEFVSIGYEYTQPPIGQNKQLTIAQIRWCVLRENMVESLRLETLTLQAADQLNEMILDMNNRCDNHQYDPEDRFLAENEVEMDRDAAISENFFLQNGEH